ncbi:uncharacterized protein LOC113472334 [Diaphorina citri]|uniref:Uncharacterized protein LOC113472334 n=1 Tax=Diaphorina citri TaxID=121845 RepID=A0A3Q0JLV7_DIACI|nr:uncharacterized protein LOC113472334 [Diaphorina citri]
MYNRLTENRVSKKMCNWIYSYYKNRKFYVKTDSLRVDSEDANLSNFSLNVYGPKTPKKGLCQGSILSGLLYILYCNKIEKQLQNSYTTVLEFVDDLSIGCTGSTLIIAQKRLQTKLNQLAILLRELQLDISPSKSKICIFTRHRIRWSPRIKINSQNIKTVTQVKFLGVWFDVKSTWQKEVEEIKNRTQKGINLLRSICGVTWGAHPTVLMNVYKAVVRSHFDYCGMIISTANQSRINQIHVLQYRALRVVLGFFKTTPCQIINFETTEMPFQLRLEATTAKYYINRKQYTQLPLHQHLEDLRIYLRSGYWRRKKKPILSIIHTRLRRTQDLKTYPRIPYFEYELEQTLGRIKCDSNSFSKTQMGLFPEFMRYMDEAKVDVVIYTDGSVNREQGISSFGIFNELTQETSGYKINLITSSWNVELLAMLEALKMLYYHEYNHMKIIIASDSQSAIASLTSTEWKSLNNETILEAKKYYKKLVEYGNEITILWVPGHQGIPGNEKADEIARLALDNGENYDMGKSPEMKMVEIGRAVTRKYQAWYENKSLMTGKQFRQLYPIVLQNVWFTGKMDRRMIITIIRMRNKHARYPVHLYRMGIIDNEQCECGERGELKHVILTCKNRRELHFGCIDLGNQDQRHI